VYTSTAPLASSTYIAPPVKVPTFARLGEYSTGPTGQVLGQVGGIGLGAYNLATAKSTAARLSAVHDILAGVFAATPIGPFIALEGLAVGTAGAYYERHLARAKLRRIKHRALAHLGEYERTMGRLSAGGLPPVFAARVAAASIRHSPEEVAPLGSEVALYNPRTSAADSPLGLTVEYGEGPAADLVREQYARAVEAELARRPDVGGGVIPQPFVRRVK